MNFLNVHILQTIPFGNLNRDDAGSPKSVIYGGTNRARLSSQSLKRAARSHFEAVSIADMTTRTKFAGQHLANLVDKMIKDKGIELSDVMSDKVKKLCLSEIKKLTHKDKKANSQDEKDKHDAKKESGEEPADTLVWLAEHEIITLATKIVNDVSSDSSNVDYSGWVQSSTSSLTIASFGRMFAAAPDVQTEAAIQVAHAFTTHAAVTEVDYFTAVDDMREGFLNDKGSGHLDLAEFTSGVFYRYFNIDRTQLKENWSDIAQKDAHDRLIELFTSMALSLPSGKTNATAPHTLPNYILLEESAYPVSYADAFESSISEQNNGFAAASRERLLDYQKRARLAMPSIFGAKQVMDFSDNDNAVSFDAIASFSADWLLSSVGNQEQ